MAAVLSSAVFVPLSEVSDLKSLKKVLTVEVFEMGETVPIKVSGFTLDRKGYIGLPRQYGLQYCHDNGIEIDCRTSRGSPVKFRTESTPRDYQVGFIEEMVRLTEDANDFVAKAATGKGKTYMSLMVALRLGVTTMVVVDQDNLLLQWVSAAKKHLGLTDDEIGIVQGPRCDYKGKKLVICMMQSLTRKTYPRDMYEWAGLVVFDEVHVAGAETFSRAMLMFSAECRFGVSATPDRRDALRKLIEWSLGEVRAELVNKHKQSVVYYLESETVYSWYANVSSKVGRIINEIAEDDERNLLIVKAIKWLYDKGRDILVLSDRIEHVENLKALCVFSGVADKDCGVYTGFYNQYRLAKDDKPERKPHGHERGTEYCPVKLQQVRSRKNKKFLPPILENSRVIFATYGMFSKGVDVPRLSAGIDCTPRSAAEQTHGRLLREGEGKLTPIWVTIRDVNNYRTEFQFAKRIEDYVKSNGEIYLWHIARGVKKQDVRELRREALQHSNLLREAKILKSVDGRNAVLLPK